MNYVYAYLRVVALATKRSYFRIGRLAQRPLSLPSAYCRAAYK